MDYSKHYISIDADSNIVKGFSDAFEQPQDGDVCINEQGGRHFELFGKQVETFEHIVGIYLYRYINNEPVEKTSEEIQAEINAMPKKTNFTDADRITALEAALMEMAGVVYG